MCAHIHTYFLKEKKCKTWKSLRYLSQLQTERKREGEKESAREKRGRKNGEKKKDNKHYLWLWKPQRCKLLEAQRELSGNLTAYLLQRFLGFPCGCCFLPPGTPTDHQSHWCTDGNCSSRRARDGQQGSPSLAGEDTPGREENGWRGKMRPLSEPLSCFALQVLRGMKMIPRLSSKTSWVGCGHCWRQYKVLFGSSFQPITLTADSVTTLSLVGSKQMMGFFCLQNLVIWKSAFLAEGQVIVLFFN